MLIFLISPSDDKERMRAKPASPLSADNAASSRPRPAVPPGPPHLRPHGCVRVRGCRDRGGEGLPPPH